MRRANPKPRVRSLVGAMAALVLLSACSGGSESDGADPTEGEAQADGQEVSAEDWMTENCQPTVAKVEGSDRISHALIAGPIEAPAALNEDSDSEVRIYVYDEASSEMTPQRLLEPSEVLCWDASGETREAYSAPLDEETTFARVTNAEFPDGAWIDVDQPSPMALNETGEPYDGENPGGLKEEYRWTPVPVEPGVMEEASASVDQCDLDVVTCGG